MSDANARPYPADNYPYQRGPDHPDWKGTAASYSAMHKRIYRARGKADHCIRESMGGCAGRFEWANISGDYNDIWDYMQLCRAHHDEYDGVQEKRRGERSRAKLTDDAVREIRRRRGVGESVASLALAFDVDRSAVYRIMKGKSWGWLT